MQGINSNSCHLLSTYCMTGTMYYILSELSQQPFKERFIITFSEMMKMRLSEIKNYLFPRTVSGGTITGAQVCLISQPCINHHPVLLLLLWLDLV